MIGIYAIVNSLTNAAYIGASSDIEQRFKMHKSKLRRNCHGNSNLQTDWNEYGEENFQFIILEETEKSLLKSREQFFIDQYDSYNIKPATEMKTGYTLSEEFRNKVRERMKVFMLGNTFGVGVQKNEKQLAILAARNAGNKYAIGNKNAVGVVKSPELRAMLSARMIGNTFAAGPRDIPEEEHTRRSESAKRLWARLKAEQAAKKLEEEQK